MPIRTPFLQVKLEGQDITDWVGSVSVTEDDKQADSVVIAIPDPMLLYSDALFEGTVVEVDMGYAEKDQHALMIRATINKIEQSYPENGNPTVTLKGGDKSLDMALVEQNKNWKDQTVSNIVKTVVHPYNFSTVTVRVNPDSVIKSKPLHQDGKTDLAFLQETAGKYHSKCFIELDENSKEAFYFIPERQIVTLKRPNQLILTYRSGPNSNLLSFAPSFDSSFIDRNKIVTDVDRHGNAIASRQKPPADTFIWQLDDTRLRLANTADKARIKALYTAGVNRKRALQDKLHSRKPAVGHVSPDQADVESTNDTLVSRSQGLSASGTTYGNIWLRAKSIVDIEGVNARFAGNWYVNSVTHKIDNNGYRTDFKCLR
jgi:phage protein D